MIRVKGKMRAIIYIGILFGTAACLHNDFRPQTGDMLFEADGTSAMGGAIEAATGNESSINYTHVAMIISTRGADSVLEASSEEGVRIIPLRQFLNQAGQIDGRPAVTVMRLRDTTGVADAVKRARKFRGQPYDYSFRPDNGRMYCSELIWESYLLPDGSHRFAAQPMNFRSADGTLPRFWIELFDRLGEQIPEGVPGTNPNDLSRDPALRTAHRYF